MYKKLTSLVRFASNYNLGANEQARSKSNEDINTNFSPTAPTFASVPGAKQSSPSLTRRNSPTKTGRSTLSAQPARQNITQRVSFEGVREPGRVPVSPLSGQQPGLFGEIPTQQGTSAAQSPFSPDQWHGKHFFGDAHQGPEPSSRRASANGGFKVPLTPHPRGTSDSNEDRDSDAQPGTNSGDAMDIDPPTAPSGQKTARPYNVAPSAWRMSMGEQNPSANHGRRRSSLRAPSDQTQQPNGNSPAAGPEAGDMPSLQPLGASLNGGSTSQGSYDMSNLQSTIPFPSKASSVHPSRLTAEQPPPPPLAQQHPGVAPSPRIATPTPKYPNYPVGPPQPQKWTRSSFIDYTKVMHDYINAMHALRLHLAARNNDALQAEEKLLALGPNGLQAQGELGVTAAGGSSGGGGTGIEAFERRLKEEDGWKEYERVIFEGYRDAIGAYVRAKEQVRRLAESGALADS